MKFLRNMKKCAIDHKLQSTVYKNLNFQVKGYSELTWSLEQLANREPAIGNITCTYVHVCVNEV
jgi:hypothetical protein